MLTESVPAVVASPKIGKGVERRGEERGERREERGERRGEERGEERRGREEERRGREEEEEEGGMADMAIFEFTLYIIF